MNVIRPRTLHAVIAILAVSLIAAAGECLAADPPPPGARPFLKPAALPPPQNLTAVATRDGVGLNWRPVEGAVQYLVLRGTSAAPSEPALATLPAGSSAFLDRGFFGRASYQIVAVAADGRRSVSGPVAFQPPMPTAKPVPPTLVLPAPAPSGSAPAQIKPVPVPSVPAPGKTSAIAGGTSSAGITPPTFTSVRQNLFPNNPNFVARAGDTIVAQGTGLDGLVSITVNYATQVGGVWVVSPNALKSFPVVATELQPTGFKFVLPQVDPTGPGTPVVVTAKKLTYTATSQMFIFGTTPVDRKITSVEQTAVRAGLRVKIHGQGFDDVIGPGGYNGVVGGYFGVGTPGSTSNPLISVGNRRSDYAELWLPATCDQEGILMLTAPRPGGGSDDLVSATPPITVTCVRNTPSGFIVGSESLPNGLVLVQPGATVTIRGTGLRVVTRVIDQQGKSYPFTYAKIGSGASAFEQLSVTMPNAGGAGGGFLLENKLTDPIAAGTVNGIARTYTVPTWYRISPAWAEAGQTIWVAGRDLSNGQAPQVTVGGVPAQLLSYDELNLRFRLASGTTSGPIKIQNPGGSVTLDGPFVANNGSNANGFLLISGPSAVASIQSLGRPAAFGDVITVTGQNLARLGGICVEQASLPGNPAPPGAFVTLQRVDLNAMINGVVTSNTEMKISIQQQPYLLKPGGEVRMYAPTTPPGDMPPNTFSCQPNPTALGWSG